MSRVRIVNGTMEDLVRRTEAEIDELVPKAMTNAEAAAVARKLLHPEATPNGTLGDPAGMLEDAAGRFEDIPESSVKRAKDLCRNHQAEDGRFTVSGMPDHDIVVVIHPTKKDRFVGVDGETYEDDHYVVFAREIGGNGEPSMVRGNCYRCNYAEERGWTAKPHDCYRKKHFPNWVPVLFSKAHGYDDAVELARELRSAWQATNEQEEAGWDTHGYPFSHEWMDGYLAAKPDAWSSTSATLDPERLAD